MSVTCLAVIGKENELLYIKTFNTDHESGLQLHYNIHTALDVIDEKVLNFQKRSVSSGNNEKYLALLFSSEESKVYGYVTNTKLKFVIVVAGAQTELNINRLFVELHSLLVKTMMNPFVSLHTKITDPFFDKGVTTLCAKPL
mmetsp:Transcript_49176/g.96408  ORF Transcript_49176/g.96408 Transcript_49176/m.96408 type:complete len:142 (+) Transcript_49176:72-497(+)|eukprot:CAMPEP_0175099142 /NCGR_PEP_ID=MMETSP0086_2-20121207/6277_1 /TAXON_ID=136419 /ORGANISM="Unknown Unknown, Strain D1" /LENGTH=141 /DNA_ID=CAMNT_0016372929 /DNA_START=29 /DNA_END=454 /DNA_ORIENTATION=+